MRRKWVDVRRSCSSRGKHSRRLSRRRRSSDRIVWPSRGATGDGTSGGSQARSCVRSGADKGGNSQRALGASAEVGGGVAGPGAGGGACACASGGGWRFGRKMQMASACPASPFMFARADRTSRLRSGKCRSTTSRVVRSRAAADGAGWARAGPVPSGRRAGRWACWMRMRMRMRTRAVQAGHGRSGGRGARLLRRTIAICLPGWVVGERGEGRAR